MSKRIFINNWDTYVSQAVFNELRNDSKDPETGEPNADANLILGTYITKDSSSKPDGVSKMLKRSKPRLSAKYIAESDLIVYDLHSGNVQDVRLALDAMKKYINSEEDGAGDGDKVLILISSLMAWDATPRKLEALIEPGTEPEEEKVEEPAEEKKDGSQNSDQEEQEASEQAPSEKPAEEENEGEEGEPKPVEPESSEVETVVEEKKKIRRKFLNHAFTEADYKSR
jgi:hypothetical protein